MGVRRDTLIAGKELNHALDNLCDSLDHVGTGLGHFVHNGWIRPYTIGHRADSSRDQSRSGTKSLGTISALEEKGLMGNPITLVGIALVLLGTVVLPRHHLHKPRQDHRLGPIQAPLRPRRPSRSHLSGGLALVGEIVLVVVGAKNS